MHVLGIDPSLTCTGFALVTEDGSVRPDRIRAGSEAATLAEIRDTVRYITGRVLRAVPLSGVLTVIEAPVIPRARKGADGQAHLHGGGKVLERAWLFGLLVDQLMLRGPVVQVRPSTRAKYAAHDGNADKKKVLAAIREAYPSVPVRDDNEADAIALAAMGARYLGHPIDGAVPSKKQAEAMTAVVWPEIERNT
jgi:Holliday junction resolvasome RuvABC endonuclease subunit